VKAHVVANPSALFTTAQITDLVAAIAVHDEIDLSVTLPNPIAFNYDSALLERCYWISYRLWQDVDRATFVGVANRLAKTGRLGGADALIFKDIRARAKQLRFAYVTLGERHTYPMLLDMLTKFMGQAQDAARSGRRTWAALFGALLRLMLSRPIIAAITREMRGASLADPHELRDHLLREMETIRHTLALPAITNKTFHDTRKIISRTVALYDSLTVLAPSEQHRAIDRYLSTINGLMGALHDDMAARKAIARRDYMRVAEPLPLPVAERLAVLTAAFAAS
jgi:hypothetical protein